MAEKGKQIGYYQMRSNKLKSQQDALSPIYHSIPELLPKHVTSSSNNDLKSSHTFVSVSESKKRKFLPGNSIFSGTVAYFNGSVFTERLSSHDIVNLYRAWGGTVAIQVSSTVTHIICTELCNSKTFKYTQLCQSGGKKSFQHVVSPLWIEQSVAAGMKLDEQLFIVSKLKVYKNSIDALFSKLNEPIPVAANKKSKI
jgi:hypothetical protein